MRWVLVGFALGWLGRGWWERTRPAVQQAAPDSSAPYEFDDVMSDLPPAAAFARGPREETDEQEPDTAGSDAT